MSYKSIPKEMKLLAKIVVAIFVIIVISACSTTKKTVENSLDSQTLNINSLIIDAVTELNKGDINKAEGIYKQILSKDKNNATALYYLSTIAFEKQDIKQSIDYIKQSIKADEKNIWYKLQLADIYLATQDYNEASNILERIVEQKPDVLEYWQQLVNIYHIQNDTKKEIATLDRMEKRFGVNDMTSMLKYNIYKEQGDKNKAEAEIKNLTKTFPTQSKYWSILAEMKMQDKDYDKAFEYYKKVEEIDPNNDLLNLTYANYYLVKQNEDSLYYYLKKSALQEDIDFQTKINIIFSVYQSKIDTDTVAFKRFFSLLETMKTTKDSTHCQLRNMLSLGYIRQNDFYSGAYQAEKSIMLGCETFETYTNWLYASSTFESPEKMIEISDKTIETFPEQPLPYLFKGVNLELKHDYQNAIETFVIGLSKAGRDKNIKEDFYMNLGDCYHALGQKDECYRNYEEVLKLNPDNYPVLNNYAYYLSLEKKDLERALKYIEKVIAQYPDNLTFVDTHAWVLYQMGEYEKAKNILEAHLSTRQNWGTTMEEHYQEILKQIK